MCVRACVFVHIYIHMDIYAHDINVSLFIQNTFPLVVDVP